MYTITSDVTTNVVQVETVVVNLKDPTGTTCVADEYIQYLDGNYIKQMLAVFVFIPLLYGQLYYCSRARSGSC